MNNSPAKTTESPTVAATVSDQPLSIRVSPNGYFAAVFLFTFSSLFLIYLEQNWLAVFIFTANWIIFPFLAWNDRIVFDGKRLKRTGFLPIIWAQFNRSNYRLRISDVEQVESQALRALKRGGNVFYRYRTSLQGKNLKFTIASGSEDYRQMIQRILPLFPENALDNRSIELRDYFADPKDTLMKAAFAHIPSVEVLENSFAKTNLKNKSSRQKSVPQIDSESEKADYLQVLGNELRLSGYLLQALEAFRRALVLNPRDARLIFDFARCLHSLAGSEKSPELKRKSLAALRLAEKRGADDGELLARLGETYFQFGDWERASTAFNKAIETAGKNFRAVRGLAEIALREGKIGYVIMHFADAHRFAETKALRRWTQNENEYFSRLHSDEDYMEMEISRVNLLEGLSKSKKTCLKIAVFSFPLIVFGLFFDELITNIGWTTACISLIIWVGIIFSQRMLSSRIPMDYDEED